MMGTTFDNKCKILATLWINFRDDEDFKEFIKYNDVSLPLAYFVFNDIATDISDKGVNFIEETWGLLVSAFNLPQDKDWESLEDIMEYMESQENSGE